MSPDLTAQPTPTPIVLRPPPWHIFSVLSHTLTAQYLWEWGESQTHNSQGGGEGQERRTEEPEGK